MNIKLINDDCKAAMAAMKESSVGGVICDPPYGLEFMGKAFDKLGEGAAQREWHREWLQQAYRALQPGGVIKAFGGTRTYHHLAAAMEDAGFVDIRVEAWTYGSGFPKSKNIALFLDKRAKAIGNRGRAIPMASTHFPGEGKYSEDGEKLTSNIVETYEPRTLEAEQWNGWGTALKPAWEPVVVGRKP